MNYRETSLGTTASFLLPSLKLKQPGENTRAPEREIHDFLMQTFGGYTATQGNLFGFWKDEGGADSYGEHRAFTVACSPESKTEDLKLFLARLAAQLGEQCIYLQLGGSVSLIYPQP